MFQISRDKHPSDYSILECPFFLTPGNNNNQCLYKKSPIGINNMYNIMNEMKADAGIEAPRITPYRYLTLILPTPKVISLCHRYRAKPACTSVQSDQALYC